MKKRLLALLLSVAMIAGMAPVSALEIKAAETDEVTLAENVTGGTYTDTTALADEAYVYTVTGDDGTTYEVEVLPDGITAVPVEEDVYTFVFVDELSDIVSGTTYMIVNSRWHRTMVAEQSAVDSTKLNYVQIATDTGADGYSTETPPDTITVTSDDADETVDWVITEGATDGAYTIKNEDTGKYLVIGDASAKTQSDSIETAIQLYGGSETHGGSVTLSQNSQYLNMHGGYATGYFAGDSNGSDGGAAIYLYSKETVATGDTLYQVDTSVLQTLVDTYEAKNLISTNYTGESWTAYSVALSEAESLLGQENTFATLEEAVAFQNSLNEAKTTLEEKYNALVQLETITIRPTWQRTLESNVTTYDEDETVSKLVKDVEYITQSSDTDTNYSVITWADRAGDILGLTTNPNMTIWDYNTDNQYAITNNAAKQLNLEISAATWNEHEADNSAWTKASVRRFTGTFTWPEGYDVDDTVIYQSVNDANYSAIYDYINSDETLKERFGDSKVYPINDDMFVFIRKSDDELTTTDYLNHMLFWSGTSGKGLWSTTGNSKDDWGRTTPATFNSVNALPAYYRIMPNNNDADGTQAGTQTKSFDFTIPEYDNGWMEHTDGWYTLVNSNTVMSTVKSLYGVEDLSNQEMVIDIFCFDNSGSGGMDEIELIFQKTPETATTVQVNYYLDSVLAANLLGSTTMTGVEHGTEITLLAGTNINELDHYRFAAATKAGTVVSNGVQQDTVPYVVDINKENNIINVVYTSNDADDRVYYFYDFGVENQYVYTPKKEAVLNQDYTITAVANTNANINASIINDGKDVLLSYTPTNSLGEMAVGTLNIEFDGSYGTEVKPIVIAPASNVLFEENFMSQSTTVETLSGWTTSGDADAAIVSDNETTVFGYTDSYKMSVGDSKVYKATVDKNDATTVGQYTNNLQFQFGGTGFDLIGTCGPNTGTISVRVVNSSGAAVKNYLVDTSFTDTTDVVTDGTTLYQVPLLQAKDLPEDTYTVTVRGAYIVYNSTATATYALDGNSNLDGTDAIADLYDLMYGVGMTEDDIDSVEYINMGKMMGASTYAATENTTDTTETVTTPTEMIIGIDGFRSYRATDYNKYPTTELGVVYQNILDCVSDGFAAYIETKEDGTYQVNEYELSGGPQNEIYLTANNTDTDTTTGVSTALAIGQANSISKQISLRSVDGNEVKVKVNGGAEQTNGKTITLNHTTEMYYEVTANEDGYIVIQVESGFLGIGNLKLTSGNATEQAVMTTALTEDDYALVATTMRLYAASPEEETPVFTPEKLEITAKVQKNKYTATITTSGDVDYITVNGEIVSKFKTKRGSDEKVFTYKGKLSDSDTTVIEVVAYDADEVASEATVYEIENELKNDKKPNKGGRR